MDAERGAASANLRNFFRELSGLGALDLRNIRVMAKPTGSGKERSASTARTEAIPPALPAWKAFVVQFTRETGVEAGVFRGRAEHLSSGQRSHFETPQELVEFVQTVLEQSSLPSR